MHHSQLLADARELDDDVWGLFGGGGGGTDVAAAEVVSWGSTAFGGHRNICVCADGDEVHRRGRHAREDCYESEENTVPI